VAMEPTGRIHWTLSRLPVPRQPGWAPDGFQIAYLSGSDLRLVAGDGSDDRLFARHVAAAAPVWRPGPGYVLAFVRRGGRITVADVQFVRRLWQAPPGPEPRRLLWSPDGSRLLAVSSRELRLFDDRGRVVKRLRLRGGELAEAASFSPDGRTIALVQRNAATLLSDVSLLSVGGGAWHQRPAANVSGEFSGVDWSPDGRWLLIAWRDADQWLFVSAADPRRLTAVSNIGRAFSAKGIGPAAFPQLSGWCCSR
jgi:TolB protein